MSRKFDRRRERAGTKSLLQSDRVRRIRPFPTMTGRRERRKELVRRALLDAAAQLFAERGIGATRVEDITERADLGKGAFYNYFQSKDSLVAELLHEGIAILEERYLHSIEGARGSDERLANFIRLHDRFFEEHPQYLSLFHQARGVLKLERGGSERLRDVFVDYLHRIGKLIHPLGGDPSTPADDVVDLAAAVTGAIAGYRSYRLAANLPPNISTLTNLVTSGFSSFVRTHGQA